MFEQPTQPEFAEPENEGEAEADVIDGAAPAFDLVGNIKNINIANDLSDSELTQIGRDVCEGYQIDCQSREDEGWTKLYEEGLKLARQVREAKSYPWQNAANIKYPLITVAAIQFAARAYPAVVDGYNVAKGKVLGEPSDEKTDRADRIGRHMSWQLLDQQPEWEADTDQMLHMLPVVGTVFRKTWFDPTLGFNTSEIITPDDLVVNYWSKAEPVRMSQLCKWYPSECLTKMRSGVWLTIELNALSNEDNSNDKQAPYSFVEQHCLIDLDGDGYPEPYIVTVHKETERVVRIVARYDENGITRNGKGQIVSIKPVQYYTKYVFIPSLDGSYYGIGFGALLNPINQTIDTLINQLLDAGTLSNLQSGFISEDIQMKGGVTSFKPGEWKRAPRGDLKQAILPLPVREPSQVLFNLLGLLIEAAKDITAVKDILTGETQGSNQAVGTTLAMIEQGLKVFTAIYKRIHRALKQELKLNYRLNALYLTDQEYFNFQDKEGAVARQDYNLEDVNVVPVSDPTIVTDMQKMARAQFMMEFRDQPGMDIKEINTRALRAASIDDIEGLFDKNPPQPPPEFVIKGQELELRDRETKLKEEAAPYENDLKEAQTKQALAVAQKTAVEVAMADPQFYATLRDMIMQTLQEAMGNMNGQPAAAPEQVPDESGLGGMDQPTPDPGVPDVSQGPEAGLDGSMGGGIEPAAGPMAGEDLGPVVGP